MKGVGLKYLIFFVTSHCNLRCKHCFYRINKKEKELSLGEIKKTARTLRSLYFLKITGGEPFLRKDLYDVVKSFYDNGVKRISISTNGCLAEDITKVVEKLKRLPGLKLELGISIDDIGDKHDKIRGKKCYGKAMETYSRLYKLRDKNFRLGFNITMMRSNQNRLEKIFNVLKKKNPDGIGCTLIRGEPKNLKELDIDIERYKAFQELLEKYNEKKAKGLFQRLRMAKSRLVHKKIIDVLDGKKSFDCLAGEKIAVLYPNGNVNLCELLNYEIGNLKDYSYNFEKLWKSRKRAELRKKIKNCQCTHECFITSSLVFNLKGKFEILREILK